MCVRARAWWSQLAVSGLWKPPWWTEHGGLTSAPEDGRCAFDWISHKDVLLWSLLLLKAKWIWAALCTAFACPIMKYYSLFTRKLLWKDMEMKQTGLTWKKMSWRRWIETYKRTRRHQLLAFSEKSKSLRIQLGCWRLCDVQRKSCNCSAYMSWQMIVNYHFFFLKKSPNNSTKSDKLQIC